MYVMPLLNSQFELKADSVCACVQHFVKWCAMSVLESNLKEQKLDLMITVCIACFD